MDAGGEGNILFELLKINLVRKQIFKYISSFSDINNLMNVCKFMKFDLEKEKIEKSMLIYFDLQDVLITYDDYHMKHDSITKIFLPIGCFGPPSTRYSTINGNIFKEIPKSY
uniref:Uncharacterized protein n=1 Tax=Strongyloides venezuelensis TaxID=75913 RepID=A0A0K0F5L0_STRVS